MFFFFNDTATTEIYTLSLHDALPISAAVRAGSWPLPPPPARRRSLARAGGTAHLRRDDRPRGARVRHEWADPSDLVRRARRPLRSRRRRARSTHTKGGRVGSVPIRGRGRPL